MRSLPERWLFVREEFGWRLAPAHGWRPNTGAARPMTADGRRPIAAAEDLVRLAPYFAMKTTDAKKVLLAIRRATDDTMESYDQLLARADRALYDVKRSGKNNYKIDS